MISGSVKGTQKLLKQFKKADAVFEKNRDYAVKESTLALHREAVLLVSENEGGTADIRYNPKRNVTVSRPGNAPHTDTGRLRQSIKFNYKDGVGQVGSNLKYAAWLEFGTEMMESRPWLSTAVRIVSKDIGSIFNKWFNKALKEISG